MVQHSLPVTKSLSQSTGCHFKALQKKSPVLFQFNKNQTNNGTVEINTFTIYWDLLSTGLILIAMKRWKLQVFKNKVKIFLKAQQLWALNNGTAPHVTIVSSYLFPVNTFVTMLSFPAAVRL